MSSQENIEGGQPQAVSNTGLGFAPAFCLSLVLSIFVSPVLAIILLLVFKAGKSYYGVFGGVGTGFVLWGLMAVIVASLTKSACSECDFYFGVVLVVGIVFMGIGGFFLFHMRKGLQRS
jgi:hypothetical protein